MLPNLSVLWVIFFILVLTFVVDRLLLKPVLAVAQTRAEAEAQVAEAITRLDAEAVEARRKPEIDAQALGAAAAEKILGRKAS